MRDVQPVVRDGMRIEWDVPIEMDDGVVLRCDVFRPVADGEYPAILSYGPYGKWIWFGDDFFGFQWRRMVEKHPDVTAGSSNRYQNFEVVDPEKFVPDGYACVRVDSRGTGRSPGFLDPWCRREALDLYRCIEWAAARAWCSGKVGLSGISYLAMNQWQVAELDPPHLAAMCVWEGAADYYRDMVYHGGIPCTFGDVLYGPVILPIQHGLGSRGLESRFTGDWVSGPETLTDEELAANRTDWPADCRAHPLASDEFWASRRPDFSKIRTPLLSAANWGGQGLHLRGNVEGFLGASSEEKWLEFHGREHWVEYYTDYGVDLHKRFFGHFLKGEDTGWADQPRVQLNVRHPGDRFELRHEDDWPIPHTRWTRLYLDPREGYLHSEPVGEPSAVTYRGLGDGVTFVTPPLAGETEVTGPVAARLWVSSSTTDADLFLVVRVFTPEFKEVTFQGHLDPHTVVGQGWLRASHRKLDPVRSLDHRPYHTHDEPWPLVSGEVVEVHVEILPTCVVVPAGHRIGLSVRGRDYAYPGGVSETGTAHLGGFTGVGPFRHDHPADRPPEVFDGEVTLHCGPDRPAHLLLPVIPPG